ncbi:MAG: transcriptional regulator [Stappia sp.]|uniref:ArsR/SmtB family transcription factor n=1 Tax=Stappia sp. TaxID=1870903 RepID=UPI000C3FACBE|nr:metalloregulator ArsR/SmtB family transcription factor [Stappia sp.]MAA98441.1 transcriptional regulator [Stappia sp.]MBM19143.1 transcriptional regulator [Stappia sp.]MBM20215.1 transcriptional regulator [Stappia sp.]|tara:strand:+ start:97 stop:402 length:306 start_codon:yes stop_codon:yes gene_type:complete
MKIEIAASQLAALGNPTRLALYRLLVRAGPGGLAVGEIRARLGIPGSTLSHHVKALAAAGLLDQRRDGTTLLCTATYPAMNALVEFLVGECCADAEPDERP